MAWDNISDVLTEEGEQRLEVGQVLMFDYEGSRIDMKIMRKTKNGVWAKQIKTYDPDDITQKILDAPEPDDDDSDHAAGAVSPDR